MNTDGRQSISFSQTIRNNFVCAVHVLTMITNKRCLSSGQEVNRIHVVKMEDTEMKPLVRLWCLASPPTKSSCKTRWTFACQGRGNAQYLVICAIDVIGQSAALMLQYQASVSSWRIETASALEPSKSWTVSSVLPYQERAGVKTTYWWGLMLERRRNTANSSRKRQILSERKERILCVTNYKYKINGADSLCNEFLPGCRQSQPFTKEQASYNIRL